MEPGDERSDVREQLRPAPTLARKPRNTAAIAAGAGVQFAVSLFVFLKLGQWLDRLLHTAPVFLFGCLFVGAGGSFYSMYRILTAAQRREDEARAREKLEQRGREGRA